MLERLGRSVDMMRDRGMDLEAQIQERLDKRGRGVVRVWTWLSVWLWRRYPSSERRHEPRSYATSCWPTCPSRMKKCEC